MALLVHCLSAIKCDKRISSDLSDAAMIQSARDVCTAASQLGRGRDVLILPLLVLPVAIFKSGVFEGVSDM